MKDKSRTHHRQSSKIKVQRGLVFGLIIIGALLAFELFNFSTTDFALNDLLGGLTFMGIRWATILAIAFCGIDFAGIACLFTPGNNPGTQKEIWYLFSAWLLAATMNALLTWWGVTTAVLNHEALGNVVLERGILLRVVPVFVAVMVWLLRVLIIGTFSTSGNSIFTGADQRNQKITKILNQSLVNSTVGYDRSRIRVPYPTTKPKRSYQSTSKPTQKPSRRSPMPEPTYHPLSMRNTISGQHGSN